MFVDWVLDQEINAPQGLSGNNMLSFQALDRVSAESNILWIIGMEIIIPLISTALSDYR